MRRGDMPLKKHRLLISILGFVTLVILASVCFLSRREPDLASVSAMSLEAAFRGDFDTWKPYAEQELEILGLNESQARSILSEFVGPCLRSLQRDGDVVSISEPNGASATASAIVIVDGVSQTLVMTARRDPQRGVWLESPMSLLVSTAMTLGTYDARTKDKRLRILKGIEKDRAKVERMGMKGIVQNGRFASWDELCADIRARVAARPM